MATATTEMCVVCREEQQTINIHIGGDAVCEDCMMTVSASFDNALQHEAHYPPTFGRYRLDPKDFVAYIENPKDFLATYREKEIEYNTPIATRLYCGNCSSFCCDKDMRRLIRLGCPECGSLLCSACGAVDEVGEGHECKKEETAFEGLEKGREYQTCPNTKCGMPVELKDGCNAMRCTSDSCRQPFCFTCGQPADHNSSHWLEGGNCPRFGKPGTSNAIYDRPPPPPPPPRHEQLPAPERLVQQEAAAAAIDVNELMAEIDRFALTDIDETLRVMQRVTVFALGALPHLGRQTFARPDTDVERLAAEANIAAELEATPIATLMHHQQNQLVALTQVAETVMADHEAAGREVPALVHAVIDMFTKLRMNLDMYVYRNRLQVGLDHFIRRHSEVIGLALGEHFGDLTRQYPMALRILYTYMKFADTRIPVARGIRWVDALEHANEAGRAEMTADGLVH